VTDRATEPVESRDDLDDEIADDPAKATDVADDEVDGDDIESVLVAAPGVGSELALEADPDAEGGVAEPDPTPAGDSRAAEPDYLGDLQRVTAEFANFRKQTEKRNQELLARASQRLAEALLPVLDACDAAAIQGVEGVEPIHAQLLSVLGNEGLEVIADVDEPFDPNRHDAVMTEPANDGDDSTMVSEVLRTGYAWKGRVFRPAMVKVRG
jgi:molecular chaperone GrpE